jgi:hypothetical protein
VVKSELCRVWKEWEKVGKGSEHPLLETGVVRREHPLLETGVGDGRYDGDRVGAEVEGVGVRLVVEGWEG